jgi:hypothetical protein
MKEGKKNLRSFPSLTESEFNEEINLFEFISSMLMNVLRNFIMNEVLLNILID